MSDDEEYVEEAETFEASGANASLVRPVRAGEVRNGHYVMLKGFPCKVR
jgi:hypothetical protein